MSSGRRDNYQIVRVRKRKLSILQARWITRIESKKTKELKSKTKGWRSICSLQNARIRKRSKKSNTRNSSKSRRSSENEDKWYSRSRTTKFNYLSSMWHPITQEVQGITRLKGNCGISAQIRTIQNLHAASTNRTAKRRSKVQLIRSSWVWKQRRILSSIWVLMSLETPP